MILDSKSKPFFKYLSEMRFLDLNKRVFHTEKIILDSSDVKFNNNFW